MNYVLTISEIKWLNWNETTQATCTETQLTCLIFLELRSLLEMEESWGIVGGLLIGVLLELDMSRFIRLVICGDTWWAVVGIRFLSMSNIGSQALVISLMEVNVPLAPIVGLRGDK